jgi:hypothetical protein
MENNNNGSKRNNEDYELAVSMQDQFMKEHNVMDYANGCGIGLIGPDKVFGYHVYFPSKEELTNFPFKEDNYQGIPIEKTVIGVIRPLIKTNDELLERESNSKLDPRLRKQLSKPK